MSGKYKFQPDYAVHPGETLREKLEELNMKPKEFAVRTGKPVKTISNVLNGKSSITSEMAVQFEKVLGIPASFWMTKQANYNEFIARETEKEDLNKAVEWVKRFPYVQLVKMGYVKATSDTKEKVNELLTFFNVSKPKAWENLYLNQQAPVFFRISLKHTKDPYALSALLRIGEIETSKIEAKPYDKKKLREILPELKKIMCMEPEDFLGKIRERCQMAGVKVVYTSNLRKTVVSGAVRWINDNPVIQMTDRFKRYDIFWFSLFHELGHVLLHGRKKNIFLEEIENINNHDEKEREANEFAAQFLLTDEQYEKIVNAIASKKRTPDEILLMIKDFAKRFGTHKDIIIGRILYYNTGLHKYGFLQKELKRIEFSVSYKIKIPEVAK
ncbi:MAG: HigA family addiction module antidote protein [Caldisericaceae bacterium]|nr:HigA family addiction module antidote protein [Caldisericaceae bacterium]